MLYESFDAKTNKKKTRICTHVIGNSFFQYLCVFSHKGHGTGSAYYKLAKRATMLKRKMSRPKLEIPNHLAQVLQENFANKESHEDEFSSDAVKPGTNQKLVYKRLY